MGKEKWSLFVAFAARLASHPLLFTYVERVWDP